MKSLLMKLNNLQKLSGDASFRSFYRTDKSVIVFCKKEKNKNLLIYDAINKLLLKNKIKAPKLISNNYAKNYIEIEDLGDVTVTNFFKKNKKNIFSLYKKIIDILIRIQKIKNYKIKDFNKNFYIPKKYNKKILFDEAKLFVDWYLPNYFNKKNSKKVKKDFLEIFKKLLNKILLKSNVFTHRDFHISNIMIKNKELYLIDSQDALIGNKAYDLASLIDDVRFNTSVLLKNKILNYYLKKQNKKNLKKIINDFKILSVLRNFKIIGIFNRLSIRDKKHQYLKMIPHAWKLIEERIKNDDNFSDLKLILKKYFPKKTKL